MPLNPVITQRLVQVAAAAATAPSGGKQAVYGAACAELGISPATLHRYMKQITVKPERKKRSDAGDVSLSREEAVAISALLMVSTRKSGKRIMSIGQAVAVLRANGEVRAERLDPATAELLPLSDSAVARALRAHGLHPDQLSEPAPAKELQSLHPNHVWQIDASLCVLYYLHARQDREAGLQVMEHTRFYKNKPHNLKRITDDRVWSYEATDHHSGAIRLGYVMGAESAANLTECLINFMQQAHGDPMHGVPFILMMDMGGYNGPVLNLCRRLQIKVIAHAAGNARATGQVENARNLIETSFEPGLRLRPVADLADLNAQAQRWAHWYNANKIHSRHGKTRYDQWLTIQSEQLRIAPTMAMCRELVVHTPEQRKVSDQLTVSFKGHEFDVSSIPRIMVGEKLHIALNPWAVDTAVVVDTDSDGNEALRTVPLVQRNEAGFRLDANVIGEDWNRHADTLADTHRKEVERFAMDATTDTEAEAKRRAKAIPFGGRIDPYKVIELAPERTYLPRAGTALVSATVTTVTPLPMRMLTLFEVAGELSRQGVAMTADKNAQVRAWYTHGVPEDELQALKDRLTVRAGLRVVNGGVQ